MAEQDNSWRTQSFRQNVRGKIEEAIRQSGNPTTKSVAEMENHVFQKAKSKEEYLGYVARLIIHVREMRRRRARMEFTRMVYGGEKMKDLGNHRLSSKGLSTMIKAWDHVREVATMHPNKEMAETMGNLFEAMVMPYFRIIQRKRKETEDYNQVPVKKPMPEKSCDFSDQSTTSGIATTVTESLPDISIKTEKKEEA